MQKNKYIFSYTYIYTHIHRYMKDFSLETIQSKRYWGIIIKVLKEKMVNLECFTSENIFQKRRQNKNFFKHKTALSSADMHYNKC